MIIYRIISFMVAIIVAAPISFVLASLIFILDLICGLLYTNFTDIDVPEDETRPFLFKLFFITCVSWLDYINNVRNIRKLFYF